MPLWLDSKSSNFTVTFSKLLSKKREFDQNIEKEVSTIIEKIQNYGDAVRKRDFGLSVQKPALDFIYKYHKHFIFDIKCITVQLPLQVRDLNEANMLLPNDKKILLRRARANTRKDF